LHATVAARGHPTGLDLSGGAAHDRAGADALLPQVTVPTLIADRGDDAEDRVLAPLRDATPHFRSFNSTGPRAGIPTNCFPKIGAPFISSTRTPGKNRNSAYLRYFTTCIWKCRQ
jgi:hypothetical protein